MTQAEDSDQEIGDGENEDSGESTLSSDIEGDHLGHYQ